MTKNVTPEEAYGALERRSESLITHVLHRDVDRYPTPKALAKSTINPTSDSEDDKELIRQAARFVKAYREGELAAERGQWEDECPYDYESPEYEAWIDGYQDRDIALAAAIEESS